MNKILINPPPDNLCCEQCGRHITELEKFRNGNKLIKNFRTKYYGTENEIIEASWECTECISKEDECFKGG